MLASASENSCTTSALALLASMVCRITPIRAPCKNHSKAPARYPTHVRACMHLTFLTLVQEQGGIAAHMCWQTEAIQHRLGPKPKSEKKA